MRTRIWIPIFTLIVTLLSVLLTACGPNDDTTQASDTALSGSVQPRQPAPHAPIPDSVTNALYERVWTAIDPGDGYRDYRYLEFDWVLWSGADVLRRSHRYSPWEGNFRVETSLNGQTLVAVGNWNSPEPTRVWVDGEEIAGDSAAILVGRAERMFELDANALLLPFRWADLGVHAELMGTDMTEDGRAVEAVEITFQSDGSRFVPRYVFWVDPTTNLPTRSFQYRHETDEEPNSATNWVDWTAFGPLMLSTRRTSGDASEIRFENIRLETSLPEGRFGVPTGVPAGVPAN